jgi:hypothetical protein
MEPEYFSNILSKHPYLFFIDNSLDEPLVLSVNIDLVHDNPRLLQKWTRKNEKKIQNIIETYINKTQIIIYNDSIRVLKERIEIFYSNLFNSDDYIIIKNSIEFFDNYNYYKLTNKTKKKKYELDTHKKIIYDFSSKYNIDLVYSFKLIYNIKISDYPENLESCPGPIYDNYLKEITELKSKLACLKTKTDNELYSSMKNYKEYMSSRNISIQVGKYWKKWNLLSKIEKNERILSFVSFYCNKNDISDHDGMIEFIKNSIELKKLPAKDIKWKDSLGIIVDIKFKYNNGVFSLDPTVKKKIIRFNDTDINDIILNGILHDNDLNLIKSIIKKNLDLKRLNKTEESIINSRFLEFNTLAQTKV